MPVKRSYSQKEKNRAKRRGIHRHGGHDSLWDSIGSAFNISGDFLEANIIKANEHKHAFNDYWLSVGDDIRNAMKKFEEEMFNK